MPKSKSSRVVVKRTSINALHPDVKATAIQLAKGDAKRIEVVSKTEAIVR
jgi:hypothetical protein